MISLCGLNEATFLYIFYQWPRPYFTVSVVCYKRGATVSLSFVTSEAQSLSMDIQDQKSLEEEFLVLVWSAGIFSTWFLHNRGCSLEWMAREGDQVDESNQWVECRIIYPRSGKGLLDEGLKEDKDGWCRGRVGSGYIPNLLNTM